LVPWHAFPAKKTSTNSEMQVKLCPRMNAVSKRLRQKERIRIRNYWTNNYMLSCLHWHCSLRNGNDIGVLLSLTSVNDPWCCACFSYLWTPKSERTGKDRHFLLGAWDQQLSEDLPVNKLETPTSISFKETIHEHKAVFHLIAGTLYLSGKICTLKNGPCQKKSRKYGFSHWKIHSV